MGGSRIGHRKDWKEERSGEAMRLCFNKTEKKETQSTMHYERMGLLFTLPRYPLPLPSQLLCRNPDVSTYPQINQNRSYFGGSPLGRQTLVHPSGIEYRLKPGLRPRSRQCSLSKHRAGMMNRGRC